MTSSSLGEAQGESGNPDLAVKGEERWNYGVPVPDSHLILVGSLLCCGSVGLVLPVTSLAGSDYSGMAAYSQAPDMFVGLRN